jgi:hypothetical protein
MLKISQADIARLATLGQEVAEGYDELDALFAEFREKFEPLVEAINEKRQAAHDVLDDIVREADEYFDDKSEKWQEGDRGVAYEEWKNNLSVERDNLAEEVEIEFPEDPERPDWVALITDGLEEAPNF